MSAYPQSTGLLIANEWIVPARDGIEVLDPSTGAPIGAVANASDDDLDRAAAAAQDGFAKWRKMSAPDRAAVMQRAAGLLRERADAIARLLTMEQGKPLAEARMEVMASADIVDWFAGEGMRVHGRTVPGRNPMVQQLVLKEPAGPVAAFTPWNYPVVLLAKKIAPALASGCSFLAKPSEETPASPAALLAAFVDAGVPAGTVGLVYGDPARISARLIAHPAIRKVSFTGSTAVGRQLAALAGQHLKRVTMELGGHAPVIVAEDADIDLAARMSGGAKFTNAGQICFAPTRFLVHASLYRPFVERLTRHAEGLKLGSGLAPDTTMGPLASRRRIDATDRFVADARSRGARLETGGEAVGGQGFFYRPTVLADVPVEADVFNQEPFGPIAAVRPFDTLDDAIGEANRLAYGLAGYAFTRSFRTVQQLSSELQLGLLWINQPPILSAGMPSGGVKDSGYGSEGGWEAMEAHLATKSVSTLGV